MSGFTKSVPITVEFDNDTVELRLARLSREDMMAFSKYSSIDGDDIKMSFSNTMELFELSAKILPKYVLEMKGLYDASGQPVDLETVINESYFIGLVTDIISNIVNISVPGSQEQKK